MVYILKLIGGALVLLLVVGLLLGPAPGKNATSTRQPSSQELKVTPAELREQVTQEIQARGASRATAWALSYYVAGNVVAEGLLPGMTVGKAIELHKAFPSFTTEWNGLYCLIWRGREADYMLDAGRRSWPWSDLLATKIAIGMPAKQVLVAWGRPTTVNRTTTVRGTEEQWVYREGEPNIILPDVFQNPAALGTLLRLDMLGKIPIPLYNLTTQYLYFSAAGILIEAQH